MLEGLRRTAEAFRRELAVYRAALAHPETPRVAKALLVRAAVRTVPARVLEECRAEVARERA